MEAERHFNFPTAAALALSLSVIAVSCGSRQENLKILKEDRPAISVKGEPMNIPDLLAPTRIYYTGKSLLFKDNKSPEAQMYVYGLSSGQTNKFIKKGRGPGEMLGAFYFALLNGNSTTLIYDITLDKILAADTDSLLCREYYPSEQFKCEGISRRISCICGYGDRLVAMGSAGDERIVELPQGDSLRVLARYIPDTRKNRTSEFQLQAFEGIIKANTANKACVVACRYADQLEIVDLVSAVPLFVKGPECFEPEWQVVTIGGGRALAHKENERKGYVDVCCDDDFIYALYSGRFTSERNSSYGNTIRVFDWNGNYVANYRLDNDVISIDVVPGEQTVYGISHEGNVLKYCLK